MLVPTCSNKFARMFGLSLADESFGPPELADGGTFAHFATTASTTPAAFFLVPRVQPLKRYQGGSNWPVTLVGTNGTKILPTAHRSYREMHPIGQMPPLRFTEIFISWRCDSLQPDTPTSSPWPLFSLSSHSEFQSLNHFINTGKKIMFLIRNSFSTFHFWIIQQVAIFGKLLLWFYLLICLKFTCSMIDPFFSHFCLYGTSFTLLSQSFIRVICFRFSFITHCHIFNLAQTHLFDNNCYQLKNYYYLLKSCY